MSKKRCKGICDTNIRRVHDVDIAMAMSWRELDAEVVEPCGSCFNALSVNNL